MRRLQQAWDFLARIAPAPAGRGIPTHDIPLYRRCFSSRSASAGAVAIGSRSDSFSITQSSQRGFDLAQSVNESAAATFGGSPERFVIQQNCQPTSGTGPFSPLRSGPSVRVSASNLVRTACPGRSFISRKTPLALHLLLQHLESLIDIVVTDEDLHAASFSIEL